MDSNFHEEDIIVISKAVNVEEPMVDFMTGLFKVKVSREQRKDYFTQDFLKSSTKLT